MSGHRQFNYEQVAAAFLYLPDTGQLFRREANGGLRPLRLVKEKKAGDEVAAASFRGNAITVTHIAFMLIRRRWPLAGMVINHRDGKISNNRWQNLREGPQRHNAMNVQEPGRPGQDDSEGLARGVYRNHNRYKVGLSIKGRMVHFGNFATAAEANAVARAKRTELHGEWLYEASRGEPKP
jgi:HNH endonuclease